MQVELDTPNCSLGVGLLHPPAQAQEKHMRNWSKLPTYDVCGPVDLRLGLSSIALGTFSGPQEAEAA